MIKPIESYNTNTWIIQEGEYCETWKVRQLELDFKEAIEAIKETTIECINQHNITYTHYALRSTAEEVYSKEIGIIEKYYGKPWEEIKELINA